MKIPLLSIGYEVFNFALSTFVCLCDPDVLLFLKSAHKQESIQYLEYLGDVWLKYQPHPRRHDASRDHLMKFCGITPCLMVTLMIGL